PGSELAGRGKAVRPGERSAGRVRAHPGPLMFLRLLFASWRARRGRLALALTAVALGVGDDLARSLRAAGPNFVVLPPGGSLDLPGTEERGPRLGALLPIASV